MTRTVSLVLLVLFCRKAMVMPKGDNVVVNCPHCGKPSSYKLRGDNTNQVDACRHCSKNFSICVTSGQVRDVRK